MTNTYDKTKTAIVISTGKELLRGKTMSTNGHFLAKKLTSLGVEVLRIVVVDDDEKSIGDEILDALRRKPSYIITTGGLGPTFDDMTVASIAKTLHLRMQLHPEALEQVRNYYLEMKRRKIVADAKLTPMRKKMAIFPLGATPLPSPIGGAPGVRLVAKQSVIFCLPGVPPEMKLIFQNSIRPEIAQTRRKDFRIDVPLPTKDESIVSPFVNRLMKKCPGVYVKSRVNGAMETIRIVLSLHGSDAKSVERAANESRKFAQSLR